MVNWITLFLKIWFCPWYWWQFSSFVIMFNNTGRYCCILLVNYIIQRRFFFIMGNLVLIEIFIRKCSTTWFWRIIWFFFRWTLWVFNRYFILFIWPKRFSDMCDNLFFNWYTWIFEARYISICISNLSYLYDNLIVWS